MYPLVELWVEVHAVHACWQLAQLGCGFISAGSPNSGYQWGTVAGTRGVRTAGRTLALLFLCLNRIIFPHSTTVLHTECPSLCKALSADQQENREKGQTIFFCWTPSSFPPKSVQLLRGGHSLRPAPLSTDMAALLVVELQLLLSMHLSFSLLLITTLLDWAGS